MRTLVTGVAGFVGSTLADTLLARGDAVVGVDCFTPYYERAAKEDNLERARTHANFTLVDADLRAVAIEPLLDGVDVVFHQAAQAGVRLSWSDGFADYVGHNILATQRLLEAVKAARPSARVVYASSSSVYGNQDRYPVEESFLTKPYSPYGVTKLAAEHVLASEAVVKK
jgi:nucleoside-diphosphate-sugar epimerase